MMTDGPPADQLPCFIKEANKLSQKLKGFSSNEISSFFKSSPALTKKILENLMNWNYKEHEKYNYAAIFSFTGDAFSKLEVKSLSKQGLKTAKLSIRILSGLYGILRPTDSILKYRLDMAQRLDDIGLTKYWSPKITEKLSLDADKECIFNLASKEYSQTIERSKINQKLIDIDFFEKKGNALKSVSIFSKQARGHFARFICENYNNQGDVEKMKDFNIGGYCFDNIQSSQNKWVFIR
tara:strand:+ start:3762 stop:4475 length:714 start_codon:yes stop_codon:yes gene_type:complete